MTRLPWQPDFPEVFVQCPWKSFNLKVPDLSTHALYGAAKRQRDVNAALDLLDDLATEATYNLVDYVEARVANPKIIAPAAQIGDSNNALAIGYAQWLSSQFDWPVEDRVYHQKAFSRDLNGAWRRIAHQCEFYGEIDTDAAYVIVDDVMTLGGTLADLRSFILRQGGRVIAMSAIASRKGRSEQIRLGDDTRKRIELLYGDDLPAVQELLGYDHVCLTEAEGRNVADCNNYVDFREKILRARNP